MLHDVSALFSDFIKSGGGVINNRGELMVISEPVKNQMIQLLKCWERIGYKGVSSDLQCGEIYMVLYKVKTNEIDESIAVSMFCVTCIKRRIKNMHVNSHKTLSQQHFVAFGVFPNFNLGTLLGLVMYTL